MIQFRSTPEWPLKFTKLTVSKLKLSDEGFARLLLSELARAVKRDSIFPRLMFCRRVSTLLRLRAQDPGIG